MFSAIFFSHLRGLGKSYCAAEISPRCNSHFYKWIKIQNVKHYQRRWDSHVFILVRLATLFLGRLEELRWFTFCWHLLMGARVVWKTYSCNSYLLQEESGFAVTGISWAGNQVTKGLWELPQGARGWTQCLFSFCILDFGSYLPCLYPRPKQPIIMFYIHCM